MKKLLVLPFVLTVFLPALLLGQSITGTTYYKTTNDPIPFDTIYLLDSTAKLIKRTTLTDIDGNFRFSNVSFGSYCIKTSQSNYGRMEVVADSSFKLKLIPNICPYERSINNKTCPVCQKQNKVIPIHYGMFIGTGNRSSMKKAGKTFKVGGCKVTGCDPNWYCKRDKKSF